MRKSITLLLSFLGLFDALYLLYIYTSPSHPMFCLGTGCDAVRASVYSHMWGVPMPVFGVIGYAVVAFLIVAESLVPVALAIEVRYALAGATAFGFLFSLYLEYLQGFVIHNFCHWCVASGTIMTLLFALSVYNVVRPSPSDPPANRAQLQNYVVTTIAAVLVGIPAFWYVATHGEKPPGPIHTAGSAQLVRPDSHVTCNPDAPVTVVEFGDFQCPVCGSEEPVMEQIRVKYAQQIRFVFRQFPLAHVHSFSTSMAEASECGGKQGKFWEMMEKIYSRQDDLTMAGLMRDAADVGLDAAKFKTCMDTGAEAAKVKQDHADGVALGVQGTPTIFIGNQSIPDIPDFDELSAAIDKELAAAKNPAPAGSTPPVSSQHTSPTPEAGGGSLLGSPGDIFSHYQGGAPMCSDAEAQQKQPVMIGTDELRTILAGKAKPLFVDVRSAKDFAAGKIPGAINIPVGEMPTKWNTLPKGRLIVFYESGKSKDICADGNSAGRTALANGIPYEQVKVYKDGLAGWQKSGLTINP